MNKIQITKYQNLCFNDNQNSATQTFDEKLDKGKNWEMWTGYKYILDNNYNYFTLSGKNKGYDIQLVRGDNEIMQIEVKSQIMSNDNILIKHDSLMNGDESVLWVQYLFKDNRWITFTTSKKVLRMLCECKGVESHVINNQLCYFLDFDKIFATNEKTQLLKNTNKIKLDAVIQEVRVKKEYTVNDNNVYKFTESDIYNCNKIFEKHNVNDRYNYLNTILSLLMLQFNSNQTQYSVRELYNICVADKKRRYFNYTYFMQLLKNMNLSFSDDNEFVVNIDTSNKFPIQSTGKYLKQRKISDKRAKELIDKEIKLNSTKMFAKVNSNAVREYLNNITKDSEYLFLLYVLKLMLHKSKGKKEFYHTLSVSDRDNLISYLAVRDRKYSTTKLNNIFTKLVEFRVIKSFCAESLKIVFD